mmetsp:Transcript_12450/g.18629  ORF Transcript_12450/g.18629 Transcript_12450/m.18629 type:complete len:590 (-) Transcript_12450:774-2543(-)
MPAAQNNAVTEERKRELLMEARRARLSWIQSSSPYKLLSEAVKTKSHSAESPHKFNKPDDSIYIINDAPIAKHLPSTVPVLNSLLHSKSELPIKTWTDKIKAQQERIHSEALVDTLDDHAFLFYYREVLQRLLMPESMDLVQGMRHFVRSFSNLAKQPSPNVGKLVSSIQAHMESVYDVIAAHSSWKGDNTHETKMMLETFVYSKCNGMILDALKENDGGDKEENKFMERLEFLQFVQPGHLEIDCISLGRRENDAWKDILSQPVILLQSLDLVYSPSQMLRCILELYREVNDALKAALASEEAQENSVENTSTRMPSADDILPTLILTLICARPKNILNHLKFLELFATPEQMRGEAGYAFTNLFSATQFIQELDLDMEGEKDSGRPTLHIDAAELKQKLSIFQEKVNAAQTKNNTHGNLAESGVKDEHEVDVGDASTDETKTLSHIHLPVSELTAARLRGENVTEWAMKWIDEKHTSLFNLQTASGEKTTHIGNETHASAPQAIAQPPLPNGFKRSYQFLATEPHDIRMSDIPTLLEEYRMLVRTTETLLVERNTLETKRRELAMHSKKDSLEILLAEASNMMEREK